VENLGSFGHNFLRGGLGFRVRVRGRELGTDLDKLFLARSFFKLLLLHHQTVKGGTAHRTLEHLVPQTLEDELGLVEGLTIPSSSPNLLGTALTVGVLTSPALHRVVVKATTVGGEVLAVGDRAVHCF